MLKLIYTSTKTIPFTTSVDGMTYVPEQDAFITKDIFSSNGMGRLFRDGTHILMANARSFGGNEFSYHPREGIAVLSYSTERHFIHPVTWSTDLSRPFTESTITPSLIRKGLYLRNSAGSLKFYTQVTNRLQRYDAVTAGLESDDVISSSSSPAGGVQWVGDTRVLVQYTNGLVRIVDVETLDVSLDSFITPARLIAYDTKYNNIVSLQASGGRVQIWEPVVEAATISALSFSPAAFERYRTEQVSVTILGSNGEPAADVDVKWEVKTLQANNGGLNVQAVNVQAVNAGSLFVEAKGKISPEFTKTNASGVATATYCPPGNDWVIGDQEIIIPTVIS